ncbi:sugar transport protein [Salmonella enterica subsp. enterica serovar Goldcoast]|nr:sugar transport protein [Salmonella enterica subsp. enterica serovar Goldcoast]
MLTSVLRRPRSVSIWRAEWRCNGFWGRYPTGLAAGQWLIAGALIFTLACAATLLTTSMTQFLVARFVQGTSICFIATVGYVTVQEAFGQTKAIKLMAIITSIVLVAPVIGPLSGAALMHFVHWKVLFGIIAVMGLLALCGLLLADARNGATRRGAVQRGERTARFS